MYDAEAEKTDTEDASVNESQLDTSAYQSADDGHSAQEEKSSVVEAKEPVVPKLASPVQQVMLHVMHACVSRCGLMLAGF